MARPLKVKDGTINDISTVLNKGRILGLTPGLIEFSQGVVMMMNHHRIMEKANLDKVNDLAHKTTEVPKVPKNKERSIFSFFRQPVQADKDAKMQANKEAKKNETPSQKPK